MKMSTFWYHNLIMQLGQEPLRNIHHRTDSLKVLKSILLTITVVTKSNSEDKQ